MRRTHATRSHLLVRLDVGVARARRRTCWAIISCETS